MAKKEKEAETVTQLSETDTIRQQISTLCAYIGDKSFVIRQANSDITGFYAQIDQLRDQLKAAETKANAGSETTK